MILLSEREQFFEEAADLEVAIDEMDFENPVAGLGFVVE